MKKSLFMLIFLLLMSIGCASRMGNDLANMTIGFASAPYVSNLFSDQPNYDQEVLFENIERIGNNYIYFDEILLPFIKIKEINYKKYYTDKEFYGSLSEIKECAAKERKNLTIKDPWNKEFYYFVIGDIFILGTSGPNKKWDVKFNKKLIDKLEFSKINYFKDDLFIKIKYAKQNEKNDGKNKKIYLNIYM